MNGEKDTLTEAMQRVHPTAEPSAALVLKVAQLAQARASQSAWRKAAVQASNKTALKFRHVLLGSLIVGVLGFGIAVGPRLYYANALNEAIEQLQY